MVKEGNDNSLLENAKRANRQVTLLICFCVLFLVLDYFLSWFFIFRVSPRFKEQTMELGEGPVSADPGVYLTGISFMHRDAQIDTSKVNLYAEGDYEVFAFLPKKTYSYVIHVADTTAPSLKCPAEEEARYELGIYYNLSDFVKSVYDDSGYLEVELFLDEEPIAGAGIFPGEDFKGERGSTQHERFRAACADAGNDIVFDEQKKYELKITATDESGNTSGKVFEIAVSDTMAPEMHFYNTGEMPMYATGQMYSAEDFLDSIEDLSGFYSTAIIEKGEALARISFDEMGDHEVTLYAVDEAGNEVRGTVTASFDDPPVFVALRSRDVLLGTEFDLLDHVIAIDNTDGDVTASIVVDDGGFNTDEAGVYDVKYTATDSYGLSTTVIASLTVGDIYSDDFYLTEEELGLLCDYDYFAYDILGEYNRDAAIELVRPALVNMIYRFGNGGYSAGSGFIYRIDMDYTYIASCVHVVKDLTGKTELMFCDSSASKITIGSPAVSYLELSPQNEVAMFRIKTSLIPAETLVELREIYSDEDIYSELEKGEEIIAYSGHWMNEEPLIRELYIKDLNSQFAQDAVNCVRTTHNVKSGMSGTAVIDERGRLAGIVEGYISYWDFESSDYVYDGYNLRIDGLEELYNRASSR
ncbi:MAG: DUF5011 domain-containing protein [Lachnospiraceae bacterium]|nr:DUF5011 domain-containing protein [Lachnospiraceae bacterium]